MPVLKYRDPDGIWVDLPVVGSGPAGETGPTGPQGPPGPSLLSRDPDNQAVLGSDQLIYVPTVTGPGISQPEADLLYVKITGGTMTGALNVNTPTSSTHAANRDYVDTKFTGTAKVTISGSAPAGPSVGDIWIQP